MMALACDGAGMLFRDAKEIQFRFIRMRNTNPPPQNEKSLSKGMCTRSAQIHFQCLNLEHWICLAQSWEIFLCTASFLQAMDAESEERIKQLTNEKYQLQNKLVHFFLCSHHSECASLDYRSELCANNCRKTQRTFCLVEEYSVWIVVLENRTIWKEKLSKIWNYIHHAKKKKKKNTFFEQMVTNGWF